MYYLVCVVFMIVFIIVCILSVIYAAEIYQWQHYNGYKFKRWLKSGSIKKDENEEKIKREVKGMTIDYILKFLKKYNIDFDANELVKASFNIKLRYYKLILAEKERIKENKILDDGLKKKIKIETDTFDAEKFQREADERYNLFMKHRNLSNKTK
ncbi:hypothetical protein E6W86_20565 [Salmonella enterica subsp. enterica serovar Berkeley]|uniref:Uncharacterized protein n=1 Tax=Salmonella enterica subsp. enterica serovar Berkeley TaxID=1965103 RepID=A0A5I3D8R0_SALET|nr:hypothetical protein [Salmonella enterica]EBQ6007243.1 hypothetical protein [Salmonella enterica subsp. enterica serovar Berkeley]EAU0184844.1 hypothetical protein [Salmonella enterica]EAY8918750.1 hypothetical protein [Salmonella enterica]ECD4423191.1 hypothetical protein [Salmonella enterica subsp. enterica serovar Berkeley]ECE8270945.1 hypothetical protein [Salmonella enterica subsp. enterica serovar Berkeley]